MKRVMYGMPPSKKGGEAKDCNILEQYLAVSELLYSQGFQRKRVFCTSNTNDYCVTLKLHPNLETEFKSIGLVFVTNLTHAFHEITT